MPEIVPPELRDPSALKRVAPCPGVDLSHRLALVREHVFRVLADTMVQHIHRHTVQRNTDVILTLGALRIDTSKIRGKLNEEWGMPEHDAAVLFEFLILEGAQAGLSWSTILNKREIYRNAFSGFDVRTIAKYDKARIDKLMLDAGIVRNRLKIETAVANARAFIEVQMEFGSFDAYILRIVGGKSRHNGWTSHKAVPTSTVESDAMSKDLKYRGFKRAYRVVTHTYWM